MIKKYLLSILFIAFSISYLLPNHYGLWLAVYQDMAMFVVLLILLILVINSSKKVHIHFLFYFTLLISCIPWLQYIFKNIFFFGDAFVVFIYLLGFSFSIFSGFNLARSFGLVNVLYSISISIIFVSIISVYIQLQQWLLLANGSIWMADLPPGGRPFANFAQPNNLATLLCLGVLSTFYLFEKKKINYKVGSILALFILLGLALTQSRTAWCFLFFFSVWWVYKYKDINSRSEKIIPFIFLVMFCVILFSLPPVSEFLNITQVREFTERATSGYERLELWQQMLYAIYQQPIWGYGWNQIGVAQVAVTQDLPVPIPIDYSHNILIDLLLWNGLPLGILIISVFLWRLYRLNKLTSSSDVFIALSMLGAILTHAMLEYPLAYAFFLIPFGLIIGALESIDPKIRVFNIPSLPLNLFVFCALITYIWFFVEYRKVEKDNELLQYELKNIGTLYSVADAPNIILLTQLREYIRFLRTEPTVGMNSEKIEWARCVVYRYPNSITLYRYAQILAFNGQIELAMQHLDILNKLYNVNLSLESLYINNNSLSFKWKNKVLKP
ncbi:PglL family O-oligosaccharyltransferase [Acinetobacter indicus]|uniref:PglL family O-oligosaccharyltransferase n=1 Tax=Acinetobacter indicus TaxID=756892 RepID=UPI002E354B93|nr:Wzy polymerase domain-containing protein [Acinetobacter indicus]